MNYRSIVDELIEAPGKSDTRDTEAVKRIATAYLREALNGNKRRNNRQAARTDFDIGVQYKIPDSKIPIQQNAAKTGRVPWYAMVLLTVIAPLATGGVVFWSMGHIERYDPIQGDEFFPAVFILIAPAVAVVSFRQFLSPSLGRAKVVGFVLLYAIALFLLAFLSFFIWALLVG
ncbi:MAG: hypothetical protein LBT26_02240 [Clostridiales Family XIII bacterium]|nr:hypothetical protein [Clostridiales Family XIII bacterium]